MRKKENIGHTVVRGKPTKTGLFLLSYILSVDTSLIKGNQFQRTKEQISILD